MPPEGDGNEILNDLDKGKEQEPTQQSNEQPKALTHEELDQVLQVRDRALIGAVQDNLRQMFDSMQQNSRTEKPEGEETDEDKELKSITQDDFYRDPIKTLNKFTEIKNRQFLKSQSKPAGQQNQPQRPDPLVMNTYVETQKIKLKERVGAEAFAKYGPHLDQVIARTSPQVLAMPETFDVMWRLTKSYVDEQESTEVNRREERNRKANLDSAGRPLTPQPKVKLDEDQARHAEAFGISADDFDRYSKPEEIEIGVNKRKK